MEGLFPKCKMAVGLVLVGGLFFLRLPFLAGLTILLSPAPLWLQRTFEIGTYALTAALIWWERDRWFEFHLGGGVVCLFLTSPLLQWAVGLIHLPNWYLRPVLRWPEIAVAAGLLLALLIWRPKLPQWRWSVLLWVPIGAAAGIALGVFTGYLSLWLTPPRGPQGSLLLAFPLFVTQLARAAVYEEPFFRGFLWGYLRKLGGRDARIWILQTILFMLGHIYYLARYPLSFWVVVPLAGFLFGLLAWRSRSIGPSMVAHGFVNAVGDLVAHYQW